MYKEYEMKKVKNLWQLYRKIYSIKPLYIFEFIVMIILSAFHPLCGFYFMSRIMNGISNTLGMPYIMRSLFFMGIVEFVYYIIFWKFQENERIGIQEIKNEFVLDLQQKTIKIPFQMLEDSDLTLLQQKALEVFYPKQAGYMDLQVTLRCTRIFLATAIQIVVLGILLILIDWKIIFLLVVFTGISIWLKTIAIDRKHEVWDQKLVKIGRQAAYYQELATNFTYAKEVRLYDLSNWIVKKMRGVTQKYVKEINRSVRDFSMVGIISSILMGIGIASGLGQLGYLTWIGKVSFAGFVPYLNVIKNFENAMQLLVDMYTAIGQAGTYLNTYWEYMDRIDSANREKEVYDVQREGIEEICFDNVYFKYPGAVDYTLQGVSFKIKPGEKVALVGENGSGKTTLIKLLLRLYEPEKGTIYWKGRNIASYDYAEYMRHITAVFQDFKILEDTVESNIKFGIPFSETHVESSLAKVGMKKKIDSLPQGIFTHLGKTLQDQGVELSGGEKQKLAIARVLVRNPDVVIMDEPTAMLSPKAEYEIYTNFAHLVKDKSALYISHRMASCRFCDWIMVLRNGNISEKGTHEQLLDMMGEYHKMYTAQASFYEDLGAQETIL